ncbi:MarR family transcriptional regulator [Microbacterium sp. NPDC079995]|uniref:MarR family winged helix-turn-helix transcriptional regulator n=1 Tax=unclassified Microbacterium TaxID=2609290 RepID=UPI00345043F3
MSEYTSINPDISPVIHQDPHDLRLTMASLVHWADSREVRETTMKRVDFPVDDMQMFLVVNQLAYRGALRPTDLATTLGTGKANMSKIVKRLEAAGLVQRAKSLKDDRSTLIALTPDGRVIGERISEESKKHLESEIEDWSQEDILEFRRLLRRFSRRAMLEIASRSPALATSESVGALVTKRRISDVSTQDAYGS